MNRPTVCIVSHDHITHGSYNVMSDMIVSRSNSSKYKNCAIWADTDIRLTSNTNAAQSVSNILYSICMFDSPGLVYVVDSSDRTRLDESREELWAIMDDDAMRDVPVVIVANKQDLPGEIISIV